MINYPEIFSSHINAIRAENRYRKFVPVMRDASSFPKAFNSSTGKEITLWCINDYLGMGAHQVALNAAINTIKLNGVGSGGTRNIGGNNNALVELEKTIAKLHEKQAALVFTSGYVANDATLSTLAKIMPGLTFFSDEANHASIIAGIRNSKAEKYIYNHIDVAHLEEMLKQVDINAPKVIVFESVYSMDGLCSDIPAICELAKKYNALTFIDEVHSVGLYGKGGAGLAQSMGVADKIDIIQGTLGKAYGAIGGYISGNNDIVDAIRLSAPGFIFTTSLPPSIASSALASILHLQSSDLERERHREVISKVKQSFQDAGIDYFKNNTHIIPIIIGDPAKAEEASRMLMEKHNIYVQHINFPTVPKGTERLRIIPTPGHTDEMINDLTKALVLVFEEIAVDTFSTSLS